MSYIFQRFALVLLTVDSQYIYPSTEGWIVDTACADYNKNYIAFDIVNSPDKCTAMCEIVIQQEQFTRPTVQKVGMCCGYKYFAGSNFHQCMLSIRDQVIPEQAAVNYHEVNLFMTKTVTPKCVSDDSVSDQNGKTCSTYYDFDSTDCGKYNSLDFDALTSCCGC